MLVLTLQCFICIICALQKSGARLVYPKMRHFRWLDLRCFMCIFQESSLPRCQNWARFQTSHQIALWVAKTLLPLSSQKFPFQNGHFGWVFI